MSPLRAPNPPEFAQPRSSRSKGNHPQRSVCSCMVGPHPGARVQIWVRLISVISNYSNSGPGQGVIKKGVFWLEESLESLRPLHSLESLDSCQILLCLPHSRGSLKSLESLDSLESPENGRFRKGLFSKRPLFSEPKEGSNRHTHKEDREKHPENTLKNTLKTP